MKKIGEEEQEEEGRESEENTGEKEKGKVEGEKVEEEKRKRIIPPGSICPFIRGPCIQEKCALWVGEIAATDDVENEEMIQVNRCAFVFDTQLQMNAGQILAVIYESSVIAGKDAGKDVTPADIIGDAYKEIIGDEIDETEDEVEDEPIDLGF